MEIGLIYSEKDPRQSKTRDFLRKFLADRGVQARLVEKRKEVASPTVVINGLALKERRQKPRGKNPEIYPNVKVIARALERQIWCL